MKLFEAFFLSLMLSLSAGAVLFVGLPLLWDMAVAGRRVLSFQFEITGIGFWLYLIYTFIQFVLSVIHLVLAIYLESGRRLHADGVGRLSVFYIAEIFLYLIVFTILAVAIREIQVIPFILAFSVPYVICCTASVSFFRYFLKKTLAIGGGEKNPLSHQE